VRQTPVDLEYIELRMRIRNAIQKGDIVEAIERINDLNPEILDNNPSLLFHLQQQRLIELIRQGRIADALVFAQQELAPRGEENPVFLAELEKTMVLLAFDLPNSKTISNESSSKSSRSKDKSTEEVIWSSNVLPPSMRELLHPEQRRRTALEVNAAILSSQSYSPTPKLPGLVRMLAWGESMLSERADFPKLDLIQLLGNHKAVVPTNDGDLPMSIPPINLSDGSTAMILS